MKIIAKGVNNIRAVWDPKPFSRRLDNMEKQFRYIGQIHGWFEDLPHDIYYDGTQIKRISGLEDYRRTSGANSLDNYVSEFKPMLRALINYHKDTPYPGSLYLLE